MPTKLTFVLAISIPLLSIVAWAFATTNQEVPKVENTGVQEKENAPSPLNKQLYMRSKLFSSQKVLEGLVTEDFAMVQHAASQLKLISEAAHWPRTVDEVYQHHSVAFRNQCDKLVDQAKRHDLGAAHYTYLHMSTTCIDCHNYVRGRFKVERNKPDGPAQLIPTKWNGMRGNIDQPQPDVQDKNG